MFAITLTEPDNALCSIQLCRFKQRSPLERSLAFDSTFYCTNHSIEFAAFQYHGLPRHFRDEHSPVVKIKAKRQISDYTTLIDFFRGNLQPIRQTRCLQDRTLHRHIPSYMCPTLIGIDLEPYNGEGTQSRMTPVPARSTHGERLDAPIFIVVTNSICEPEVGIANPQIDVDNGVRYGICPTDAW